MSEKKLFFKQTCFACPEQYDVFLGKKRVAYVRLRWGCLRVDMPSCGGNVIYKHFFRSFANKDFSYVGCFCSEKERKKYLNIIEKKILRVLERKKQEGEKK